jgi:hypothetical protein
LLLACCLAAILTTISQGLRERALSQCACLG